MSGFQILPNLIFLFFVFQKKAWHTIKTMVNLPVISPFKKRYSWVQLAGHTGEMSIFDVSVSEMWCGIISTDRVTNVTSLAGSITVLAFVHPSLDKDRFSGTNPKLLA